MIQADSNCFAIRSITAMKILPAKSFHDDQTPISRIIKSEHTNILDVCFSQMSSWKVYQFTLLASGFNSFLVFLDIEDLQKLLSQQIFQGAYLLSLYPYLRGESTSRHFKAIPDVFRYSPAAPPTAPPPPVSVLIAEW